MAEGRRSPYKATPRSLRENQLAAPKYTMEKDSNQLLSVPTYIEELKVANLAVWNAIADDPNVKNALFAVAEMGYRNSPEFYHATSYLLNCISNAYLEASQSDFARPTEAEPAQATVAEPARPTVAGPADATVTAPDDSLDAEPADTTEAGSADRSAIVFSSAPNNYVPGDYLGARIKPDLTASTGDMSMLASALQASAEAPLGELPHFHLIISFGEWKLGVVELGQFLWYLAALKRYRQDLPAVHGIYLDAGKQLRLITLNACGCWSSTPVDMGVSHRVVKEIGLSGAGNTLKFQRTVPSTDTWIAYVVALYNTQATRDIRFSLADPAADLALWNVKIPDFEPITVRPFHATHCPGRMTWASFVLDLPSTEADSESSTSLSAMPSSSPSPSPSSSPPPSALARGFLKTSWQDSSATFTEMANLNEAHDGGWLPGLVRHWTATIDPAEINLHEESSHRVTRRKELVYLASLGHPLSQCKSALHLLRVIYDAVETHAQLLNRDILHGDMSWFNILCNPWHDEETVTGDKPVTPGIPCIDFILTGDKKRQPCALVLDLDHASLMRLLYNDAYSRRKEKTGTPMFVSVALSSKDPIRSDNGNLATIVDRLAVLDREEYAELRARAFPNGDNDFMAKLRIVFAKEQERLAQGVKAFTNPKDFHRPGYDVESLYWVLLWALSRACPLGHSPHGTPGDALSQFVDIMLEHRVGHDESRSEKLFGNGPAPELLHPLLRKDFHPALEALAIYLSVPWHRYVRTVHATHAHVAIRRILLPLIDRIMKRKVKDVEFNTAQPRTVLFRRSGQDRKCPTGPGTPSILVSADRAIASNSRCRSAQAGRPPSQKTSLRSEQPVVVDKPSAPAKQPPGYGQRAPNFDPFAALPDDWYDSDSESPKKRAAEDDDDDDEPESKRAKIELDYTEPTRDVETLINMFWADRNLWFGTGFHNEADMNAAMAAALKDDVQP